VNSVLGVVKYQSTDVHHHASNLVQARVGLKIQKDKIDLTHCNWSRTLGWAKNVGGGQISKIHASGMFAYIWMLIVMPCRRSEVKTDARDAKRYRTPQSVWRKAKNRKYSRTKDNDKVNNGVTSKHSDSTWQFSRFSQRGQKVRSLTCGYFDCGMRMTYRQWEAW